MVFPPPIRPTFDVETGLSVEETVGALRGVFGAEGDRPFQCVGQHVVVTVRRGERHFWSPYLTMEAQAREGGVRLHGRFSPKPAVWTAFMLSYVALLTAGGFGVMFAASQCLIGASPWLAVGLAVVLLAVAGGMYAASQVGQGLARPQMEELRGMVDAALGLEGGRLGDAGLASGGGGEGGGGSDSGPGAAGGRPN